MLTKEQVIKYRKLNNAPQYLYNAIKKQINIKRSPGRSFSVPEGGYIAHASYYHLMRILEYDDETIKSETGFTDTTLKNIQKYIGNSIKSGGENDRVNTKFQLIANYMIHEQLGYPYEDKTNV